MPLYGYRCTQCGHRFDKIQKFSDEQETVCPKCGGALERPLTAPALQFKGAGWYVNDYAAKPAAGGNADKISAEAAPAGETKPAESKPGESKPAESKPAAGSSAPSSGSSPAASSPSATSK
ncbi:MAG: FmdB family zinc ribbon protein [Terracidiphilus sp.]